MDLINPIVRRWMEDAADPETFWARRSAASSGYAAVVGELNFVDMLPKTRSGEIMRRVLKAVTLGREPGDIATIEDEGSVEQARHAWSQMSADIAAQRPV